MKEKYLVYTEHDGYTEDFNTLEDAENYAEQVAKEQSEENDVESVYVSKVLFELIPKVHKPSFKRVNYYDTKNSSTASMGAPKNRSRAKI